MTKKSAEVTAAPISRTSAGLRDAIFDEIDAIRNGTSNPTRANAVAKLATGIVETVEGETHERHWGPATICKYCSTPFVRRSRRGDYWSSHSTVWNDALAELAIDRTAKRRMEENASTWSKLRFDPRSNLPAPARAA